MATPSKIHVGAGTLTLNPDTVPVDLGLTSEGATLKYSGKLEPIVTDQFLAPVGYYVPGEECTFETILSEASATKLKYALGSANTVSTVAASSGQVGYDKITFGGETVLTDYVLEYASPKRTNRSLNIRIRLYKVNISTDLEMVYKKDGTLGFKLTAMAVCDTSKAAGDQLGYYMEETAVATDGSPAQLTVSSVLPLDNATGVAITDNFVVTFNRAVHPDCVHSGNFIIINADGTHVAAAVTQTGAAIVTINPTASLTNLGVYIVAVAKDCIALSDYTTMAANLTYNFTCVAG